MDASEIMEIYLQENLQQENLHSEAATQLIWKKMLQKSKQNSWKIPAKELTLQHTCRLEACNCT